MKALYKRRADSLAERLAIERRKKRQVLIDQLPLQAGLLARLKGEDQKGIDENGKPQKTKAPETFNVKIKWGVLKNGCRYPSSVMIKFKKNDPEYMATFGLKETEKRIKTGQRITKKTVEVNTDIFHAVRACKHLREGYQKELEQNSGFLTDVEKLNARLSELHKRGGISAWELSMFLNDINGPGGLLERTSGWKNFGKRIAKDYLTAAAELLNKAALTENPLERSRFVVGACAKITAFRNRLGEWRDREVGNLLAWNHLRECSLRAVRDSHINALVDHCLCLLKDERLRFAAVKVWKRDMQHLGMLLKIKEAIEEKNEYQKIRALAVKLYRCAKSTRIESDIVAIGKMLKEDPETAKRMAERLSLFLKTMNPFYAVEELEKTADPYLGEFVRLFKLAVDRMLRDDVWRAAAGFWAAKKELEKYVF